MNRQEMREKLMIWWNQLASREKKTISIGGLILIFFFIYQCLWTPLQSSLLNLRQRIISEQKTVLWMQSVDKMMQAHGAIGRNKVSPVILLDQMQKQIRLHGLESGLGQLKQSENKSITMQFQKVEFDRLMTFLMGVVKENPVSITRLSVHALDVQGYVSTEIAIKQFSH